MSKDITLLSLSQQLIQQNSNDTSVCSSEYTTLLNNNLHVDNAHKYSYSNPTGSLHVILYTNWVKVCSQDQSI